MKIKTLLKEIETANKINLLAGNGKIELVLEYEGYKVFTFDNYKDCAKTLKNEFIEEAVEAINNFEIVLNKKQTLNYVDRFGDQSSFTIEFTLF